MLYYAVITLHIIVCIILVLVVLLQSGKGADLAGAFGGGATQTAFGSRGPASFLSKMTTAAAVVFMLTCITLSLLSNKKVESKSIMETTTQEQTAKPAQKKAAGSNTSAVPLTKEQIRKIQEEYEAKQKQKPASKPTESKQPAK
jgi:preprotein translocase subunit SecG